MMAVSKASQTSYLEVLQNVLVENVFNIHGLLTVIVGGAVCPFVPCLLFVRYFQTQVVSSGCSPSSTIPPIQLLRLQRCDRETFEDQKNIFF